jgi:hypothetical protein
VIYARRRDSRPWPLTPPRVAAAWRTPCPLVRRARLPRF